MPASSIRPVTAARQHPSLRGPGSVRAEGGHVVGGRALAGSDEVAYGVVATRLRTALSRREGPCRHPFAIQHAKPASAHARPDGALQCTNRVGLRGCRPPTSGHLVSLRTAGQASVPPVGPRGRRARGDLRHISPLRRAPGGARMGWTPGELEVARRETMGADARHWDGRLPGCS